MRRISWVVVLLVLLAVTGCGREARSLKDIIVKQLNIPVETVEIIDSTKAVGTLASGEKLAIRWKRRGREIKCICQTPKAQAEEEVRKIVSQMGYAAKSVDIKPSGMGVGYIGEVTADNGVSFDVTDHTDENNLTSVMYVEIAPRSYALCAKFALEKELNAKVVEDAAIQPGDLPPLLGGLDAPLPTLQVLPKKSLFRGWFKANHEWYAVELYEQSFGGLMVSTPGQPKTPDTSSKLGIDYRKLP